MGQRIINTSPISTKRQPEMSKHYKTEQYRLKSENFSLNHAFFIFSLFIFCLELDNINIMFVKGSAACGFYYEYRILSKSEILLNSKSPPPCIFAHLKQVFYKNELS